MNLQSKIRTYILGKTMYNELCVPGFQNKLWSNNNKEEKTQEILVKLSAT
jgi:hypothetical protein